MLKRWLRQYLGIATDDTQRELMALRRERDMYKQMSQSREHMANGTVNALLRIAEALDGHRPVVCTSDAQEWPSTNGVTVASELKAIRQALEALAYAAQAAPKAAKRRR